MEEVEVTIQPDGSVQVKVSGVKGSGCRNITAPLEDLLGGQIVERELSEEYYQSEENQTVEQATQPITRS